MRWLSPIASGLAVCNDSTRTPSRNPTGQVVTDLLKQGKALDIIMQQHGALAKMEFDPKEVEFIVVLKLTIESMTGKQSSNWNRFRGGEKG